MTSQYTGCFKNMSSCMSYDQGHEQNNEVVKSYGVVVGITENPTTYWKWMTAGPEPKYVK